ncbi:MAG: DUF4962 domain-containing protein [Planctomycetota bacterium]|jgi:hypothetical protein
MQRLPLAITILALLAIRPTTSTAADPADSISFPKSRPAGGGFVRPRGEAPVEITPPGFCWWRAAARGKVQYRLEVADASGERVYGSPLSEDPVCVPDRVFAAGRYTWTVEAIADGGEVVDRFGPRQFTIADGAPEQPWIRPVELLARVAAEHPRLLFPKARLAEIRATLGSTRKEAFESLKRRADGALRLSIPPEPDYDKIKDPAKRRLGYVASFREMRRYHTSGMPNLALMYLLSGEGEYGRKAKALLLGAAEWDPEGVSSVMGRYGDEVGLGLAKSAALTYDWIDDLLDDAERQKVRQMLVARADQMLRRLERRDFLNRPESSHDGRLPGYLVEHAIALAEEPRAEVWMDYALRTIMTVFPHWAGQDGGWAEGLAYGTAYNGIFVTPLESLRIATGVDVWKRPFFRKVPYFFLYNVSPEGEIMGFGDSYDGSVPGRADGLRGLMQFYAERFDDPTLRWWVDTLHTPGGGKPSLPSVPGLILPQAVEAKPPVDLPRDAAFTGVGWAALHSDLERPQEDLFVAFKSSPYGPVSHSFADQNSFAILKGGRALARPGGTRYPQHGTPFHVRFTQQTAAQNAILVDGEGQINRRASANGRLVAFESRPRFGYVCGDAAAAYGDRLDRFRRHVLLVRPLLVCVIDDLEAPKPAEFQWLMHAFDKLDLDERRQTLVSRRGDAAMKVHLITPGGFAFSQTDAWPLDPKTGFPTATAPLPRKLWHFTAGTRERSAQRRIAAVMVVGKEGEEPDCEVRAPSPTKVEALVKLSDGEVSVGIDLSTDPSDRRPILEVHSTPREGEAERFVGR